MFYETILVTELPHAFTITIHRPKNRNSMNKQLLLDLHDVLNRAEQKPAVRLIFIQGENGLFCTGMDFEEVVENISAESPPPALSSDYMALLKRFSSTSKIIVALLDGQVLAGGVGIAAASDIVVSTSRTHFALSEALWGLLPACVMPYLIRRIGFQKAYHMTLTTQTIAANEAKSIGLIDELNENLAESIRHLTLRLLRVHEETVADLKSYFRKMWIISEAMENTAIAELNRLVNKPRVINNIRHFIENQSFPWESAETEAN